MAKIYFKIFCEAKEVKKSIQALQQTANWRQNLKLVEAEDLVVLIEDFGFVVVTVVAGVTLEGSCFVVVLVFGFSLVDFVFSGIVVVFGLEVFVITISGVVPFESSQFSPSHP